MPKKANPESLWTAEEAAQFLKCTTVTVYRMIQRGELRAIRFGRMVRIDPADVQRAGKPVRAYQSGRDFLAELGGGA